MTGDKPIIVMLAMHLQDPILEAWRLIHKAQVNPHTYTHPRNEIEELRDRTG